MSLSKPIENQSSNPVKRYYTWNGASGTLSYWDKEKEEKVEHGDQPFIFIPTDQRNMVEGYDSKKNMGFRSNEVISTINEELVIKWNSGTLLLKGFYAEIKEKIKAQGGKYTKSIYGITKIDDTWELVNLKIKGAAFSSWLAFDQLKKGGVNGLTIAMLKGEKKKTGMVEYFEPKFQAKQTSEDIHSIAVEKDVELQDYFTGRDTPLGDVNLEELTADEKKQLKAPSKKKVEETSQIQDFDEDGFFANL